MKLKIGFLLCISSLVLAGCGTKEEEPETNSSKEESSETSSQQAEDRYTITKETFKTLINNYGFIAPPAKFEADVKVISPYDDEEQVKFKVDNGKICEVFEYSDYYIELVTEGNKITKYYAYRDRSTETEQKYTKSAEPFYGYWYVFGDAGMAFDYIDFDELEYSEKDHTYSLKKETTYEYEIGSYKFPITYASLSFSFKNDQLVAYSSATKNEYSEKPARVSATITYKDVTVTLPDAEEEEPTPPAEMDPRAVVNEEEWNAAIDGVLLTNTSVEVNRTQDEVNSRYNAFRNEDGSFIVETEGSRFTFGRVNKGDPDTYDVYQSVDEDGLFFKASHPDSLEHYNEALGEALPFGYDLDHSYFPYANFQQNPIEDAYEYINHQTGYQLTLHFEDKKLLKIEQRQGPNYLEAIYQYEDDSIDVPTFELEEGTFRAIDVKAFVYPGSSNEVEEKAETLRSAIYQDYENGDIDDIVVTSTAFAGYTFDKEDNVLTCDVDSTTDLTAYLSDQRGGAMIDHVFYLVLQYPLEEDTNYSENPVEKDQYCVYIVFDYKGTVD